LGLKSRVGASGKKPKLPAKRTRAESRFAALRGTRNTGMSTDAIMHQLRGYGHDARGPGFAAGKYKKER
jgi:hypothetical protein